MKDQETPLWSTTEAVVNSFIWIKGSWNRANVQNILYPQPPPPTPARPPVPVSIPANTRPFVCISRTQNARKGWDWWLLVMCTR